MDAIVEEFSSLLFLFYSFLGNGKRGTGNRNRKLGTGNRKQEQEIGNGKQEIGNGKQEKGKWETGNREQMAW
ncbi:hypothetical protein HXZ78_16850 [Myroides odoratimimus]|uniref:Uncharacterized protein n=1 Tax=Myroides odoratimimus TaxID=76832 RepID=A0AAI8G6G9_9FLAO|nr:hypothetical protein [Myroides odoratimimus]ALU27786.1 hypothetical protein AS202_17260 [Myroides odoratimimus]MDM1053839.1 hypothetical protein [Myroides odoratimimus]MDM1489687.1 hypothetical protein [Myroides odoratimimus]MDM1506825.1 hypothetical protein [Myroides odoratimimus]MEC4151588.1 hypothetical protein [Myroides odoratimimus]